MFREEAVITIIVFFRLFGSNLERQLTDRDENQAIMEKNWTSHLAFFLCVKEAFGIQLAKLRWVTYVA